MHAKGDLAAAEPLLREVLEGRRDTLGNRHPNTLTSISNLCNLLKIKGDLAAAELLHREALEARRETLGDRHPDTRSAPLKTSLVILLKVIQGRIAAAEPKG